MPSSLWPTAATVGLDNDGDFDVSVSADANGGTDDAHAVAILAGGIAQIGISTTAAVDVDLTNDGSLDITAHASADADEDGEAVALLVAGIAQSRLWRHQC